MKLFEKAEPGESIQVDVKYVQIAGRWAFQYTALDDCTRFRILRLYLRLHHRSSLAFLAELQRAFPFPIQRLQCDRGQESPSPSCWGSKPLGSGIGTSGPGVRNRTAKSSGATASIRRSSGVGTASPSSRRPLERFEPGKPRTTINASLWPFRAAPRPKNWPRSARLYGQLRHFVSTRARYLNSGSLL